MFKSVIKFILNEIDLFFYSSFFYGNGGDNYTFHTKWDKNNRRPPYGAHRDN